MSIETKALEVLTGIESVHDVLKAYSNADAPAGVQFLKTVDVIGGVIATAGAYFAAGGTSAYLGEVLLTSGGALALGAGVANSLYDIHAARENFKDNPTDENFRAVLAEGTKFTQFQLAPAIAAAGIAIFLGAEIGVILAAAALAYAVGGLAFDAIEWLTGFDFPDWFTDFPWVSPLVIDMDGDGIETTGLVESFTYFDLNNDGFAERTGWVSADDALLVRDSNGDGVINHGFELFGTSTRDGFSVLGAYDENSDGVITSADRVFEELRVWRDANSNGKQDDGEMQSLAQLGIASIDVAGVEELTTPTFINDNKITHTSTITYASGGHAAIADVWFKTSTQDTRIILDEDFEYSLLAQKLPQLAGKVPDLCYVAQVYHDDLLSNSVRAEKSRMC